MWKLKGTIYLAIHQQEGTCCSFEVLFPVLLEVLLSYIFSYRLCEVYCRKKLLIPLIMEHWLVLRHSGYLSSLLSSSAQLIPNTVWKMFFCKNICFLHRQVQWFELLNLGSSPRMEAWGKDLYKWNSCRVQNYCQGFVSWLFYVPTLFLCTCHSSEGNYKWKPD